MYKLVAVDMDGTLLNKDSIISEENRRAIEKARSLGVKVVIASGRPLKGLYRYLKELNMISEDDYVVAFNGALVQNVKTGEVLYEASMSNEDLDYLYSLSQNLNVNIHILTQDKCLTPKMNKYSKLEADLNNIPLEIDDFNSLNPSDKIIKIMMIDDPEILDRVIRELPSDIYDKYTVVRSMPFFLEFLGKETNKGSGVEALAKHLEISKEQIICMGDAGNDVHMIEFAGLGVAMGNAFPEVKEIADYVTKTNDEHGVAHVIEKFISRRAS